MERPFTMEELLRLLLRGAGPELEREFDIAITTPGMLDELITDFEGYESAFVQEYAAAESSEERAVLTRCAGACRDALRLFEDMRARLNAPGQDGEIE